MFTIEQIKTAHGKVKSGADFPRYAQEIIALGVIRYEHFLSDGHIIYVGKNGFVLSAPRKWEERHIADKADKKLLYTLIKEHQQGKSDYPTICLQASQCGVDKWVLDLEKMTCTYYDKSGDIMLLENIPTE